MYDEAIWLTLIYDFYGQLLPDKQIEAMNMHYEEDMSYAEIGQQLGMTRQGVYHMVKTAKKNLFEYEDKLGLLAKFLKQRDALDKVKMSLEAITNKGDFDRMKIEIDNLIDNMKNSL